MILVLLVDATGFELAVSPPARSVLNACHWHAAPSTSRTAFVPGSIISSNLVATTKKNRSHERSFLVDATRFELATSASRTQRSTKLSHASILYSTQSGKLVFQISEGFMYLQNHTQKFFCFLFLPSDSLYPNFLVKPSTY